MNVTESGFDKFVYFPLVAPRQDAPHVREHHGSVVAFQSFHVLEVITHPEAVNRFLLQTDKSTKYMSRLSLETRQKFHITTIKQR